jgi:hypothetical protein
LLIIFLNYYNYLGYLFPDFLVDKISLFFSLAENGNVGYLINNGNLSIDRGFQQCDGGCSHSMGLLCVGQYE